MIPQLKLAGLIAISGLFSLCLAEAGLRMFYPFKEETYLFEPGLNTTFYPDSNLISGIYGPGKFSINALGLRGPNPEKNQKWVQCIGGSTTECLYLDDSETWYAVLQSKQAKSGKNICINSAGKSGHTSREHLAWMENLCSGEKRPDAILLMCGINDLLFMLSRDNSHVLKTNRQMTDSISQQAFIHKNFNPQKPGWRGTAIGFLFSKWRRNMGLVPHDSNTQMDLTGKVYTRWREHRQNHSEIILQLPDLNNSLNEFSYNVEQMIRLAQKHKIEMVLIQQAAAWEASDSSLNNPLFWMGGIGNYQLEAGHAYYSPAALASGLKQFNEAISVLAQKHHLRLVNLNKLNGNKAMFYDDCHFTEAGAKAVADEIFSSVQPF